MKLTFPQNFKSEFLQKFQVLGPLVQGGDRATQAASPPFTSSNNSQNSRCQNVFRVVVESTRSMKLSSKKTLKANFSKSFQFCNYWWKEVIELSKVHSILQPLAATRKTHDFIAVVDESERLGTRVTCTGAVYRILSDLRQCPPPIIQFPNK